MIDDEKDKPHDEPQVAEDSQGDQDEQGSEYVGPSDPEPDEGEDRQGDPPGPGKVP